MGRLNGRVAIVTGAGRGLGRAHALRLAAEGAAVVVNDLGGDVHGEGQDPTPAQEVVEEIQRRGGQAIVSGHDVADWQQAAGLIQSAVDAFGDLHVLVNNAGILRDRTLANMSEAEWDAVIRVHLKGHAATTRHAMSYWRDRAKAGQTVNASLIHTTSIAAFAGSFGQANYSAAKMAIVGLSRVAALEGVRYGVRSNAVSPSARTRIGMQTPGADAVLAPPTEPGVFDRLDPANVSPLVAWLAAAECPATAQVFHTYADRLIVVAMPSIVHDLRTDGQWTLEALDRELAPRLLTPPRIEDFLELTPQVELAR
jgi:NAD(P)-dependent dehydrogenase (short-subunit alcohol dehydrogenase family)